jgi:hypothetical protein
MKALPPGEAEQLWQQSLFEMVGQPCAQAEFNVAVTGTNGE